MCKISLFVKITPSLLLSVNWLRLLFFIEKPIKKRSNFTCNKILRVGSNPFAYGKGLGEAALDIF